MKDRLWSWLTAFWLLSVAVVGTFLIAWAIYPFEISFLKIENATFMTASSLQANFNYLMNYLLNPFSGTLAMPDFPSSVNGLKHFADVKNLFIFAETVLVLLAYPAIKFLVKAIKGQYLRLYRPLFLFMIALPLLIGLIAVLIGFDQFFVLFHSIFFPGDSTWLFDPRVDPVILALPETYFLHCFVIFFVLYMGIFGSLHLGTIFERKNE